MYGKFRKAWRKRVPKYARRTYKFAKTAFKLAKDVAAIKTSMNVEKKYHDRVSLVSQTVTATAPLMLFVPWDELTQGTGPDQRVGQQVKALWTQFRFGVTLNGDASKYRVVVVHDYEGRGAAALAAITLQSALFKYANLAPGPEQVHSPYRTFTSDANGLPGDRFRILFDKVYMLDNVAYKQRNHKLSFKHTNNKSKGIRIKYRTDTDEPLDDRLYVLIIAETTVANTITITGQNSRFCFVDN